MRFSTRLERVHAARSTALVVFFACVCGLAGCTARESSPAPADGSMSGWNVVLLTLDTTRRDHLGCYGKRDARTPALDALAEGGITFDRAVAQAPITLPSHASIFTGLNPPNHGVRGNGVYALPERQTTLAETLSEAGYETAAVVAAFVLDGRFGLSQGFDRYDDDPATMLARGTNEPSRAGSVVTATALRLMDSRRDRERPYFLWAHYFDPHHPYEPPSRFGSAYPDTREGRYQGEIDAMDAAIGTLLDGLRERDLLERTLVIAVADHGEGITGPHAESTHGLLLYEDTLAIPLVIHAEGALPAGRRDDTLTRQIDLFPTILELLEIPGRDELELDGASFAARLREFEATESEAGTTTHTAAPEAGLSYAESFLGWDSYGWAPIFQVRSQDWKYIESSRDELYDLASDPEEARDLAAGEPARVAAMSQALSSLRGGESFGAGKFAKSVVASREDTARLRALGYIESADQAPTIADPSKLRHPADSLDLFDAIDEARFLQNAREHERALAKIDGVLAEDPRNYLALAMRAESLQARGDFAAASDTLRQLVELRPDEPGNFTRLGMVELRLAAGYVGDVPSLARRHEEAAVQSFERAIELGSPDVAPYLGLGRYCVEHGEHARAIELLETAMEINDRLPTVHYLLGFARGEEGDPNGALRDLGRAFELARSSPPLLVEIQRTRATNELRLGEPNRAIEHLQWILDRNPEAAVAEDIRAAIARIRRVHR